MIFIVLELVLKVDEFDLRPFQGFKELSKYAVRKKR
jgi:hypothetical protein